MKLKSINEIDVVLDAIGEYCNEHSYYSGDLEKIKTLSVIEDKLKAWKRLRDKGFRVTLHGCKGNAWLHANWDNLQGDYSDVLLLFGGEK